MRRKAVNALLFDLSLLTLLPIHPHPPVAMLRRLLEHVRAVAMLLVMITGGLVITAGVAVVYPAIWLLDRTLFTAHMCVCVWWRPTTTRNVIAPNRAGTRGSLAAHPHTV